MAWFMNLISPCPYTYAPTKWRRNDIDEKWIINFWQAHSGDEELLPSTAKLRAEPGCRLHIFMMSFQAFTPQL